MSTVEIDTPKARPFGQSDTYDKNLLRPTFKGFHYKFTLLLPLTERAPGSRILMPVFGRTEQDMLETLFTDDFHGYSHSNLKGPFVEGKWKEDDISKPAFNKHARYEVYSLRGNEPLNYFTELKARLHQYAEVELKIGQKEIVIEQHEVNFISEPFMLRV